LAEKISERLFILLLEHLIANASGDCSVKNEKEDVVDSLVKRLSDLDEAIGGKCPGCGYESPDNEIFTCECCGAPVCTYCHNMTNDCTIICRSCIESNGLTNDDVQYEEDGAGRPFF
jgi:hypothetical protein